MVIRSSPIVTTNGPASDCRADSRAVVERFVIGRPIAYLWLSATRFAGQPLDEVPPAGGAQNGLAPSWALSIMSPARPYTLAADQRSELDCLADLEQRHDDLLRRLEELQQRVEKVLADWSCGRTGQAG